MDTTIEILTSFLTAGQMPAVLAIGISLLAIAVAFWTARITRKSVVSELLLDFSRRYNDHGMREAMVRLTEWYNSVKDIEGSSFARNWYDAYLSRDLEARKRDEYRRDINRYYSDLARLKRNGLLEGRYMRMAGRHYAINVYYRVVTPMNRCEFGDEFDADRNLLEREVGWYSDKRLTGEVGPIPQLRFGWATVKRMFWGKPQRA